ncbi:RHS repeat-associated core domain-containing protein [Dactylosporangium salmoneum]
MATALVFGQGLFALPAAAAPQGLQAQTTPSVHGTKVKAQDRPADLSQGAAAASAPVWPAGGTAVADSAVAGEAKKAGALPVSVAGSGSRTRITVLDRQSLPSRWNDKVLMKVERADAGAATKAEVNLDYGSFATAYGGDWASRLRLVAVPDCALSTPDLPQCATKPLPTRNDTKSKRLTATVDLPAVSTMASQSASVSSPSMMLAAVAGPSGSAGDYKATGLQASSTWSAGGNSGDFSWQYPMRSPPALGGPAPVVTLAYSSTSVDGRSEATNNQPSWIGEGFDYQPGFVERRYKQCVDDKGGNANNTTDSPDQCWGTDNATLSLNGRSNELIRDDATGTWKLKNDDGSKIERLNDTVNGDNDNEYWKLTSPDGNQFFFGRNRLPGYTGTAPANKVTNSVQTVPVAGNNVGEPCRQSGFVASFCNQAYRWNLDYVLDPHGNSMSLFYTQETNKYGRNLSATDVVSYSRAAYLDHIDYGTDNRSGTDTENTSTAAPARVVFTAADRCLSACTTHDQAHWPDTPWDQECTGSPCTDKFAPTFWTTKRLGGVTMKVWDAGTSQYRDTESWTLTHNFPDPGDGTRAGLWLESIVHKGLVGGTAELPEVNFDWIQKPNRVDTFTDGKPAMNWMRMGTIWTETGAKLDIRYTEPDCVVGSRMPASPQNNTLRCYPVLEEQQDKSIKTEYFHKYLVTSVVQADRLTGAPDVETSYEYVGTPAYRHTDDDGLTKDKLRTWSDFRGYSQVNTRVGTPGSGTETLSETVYYRGMHGDLNGSGGTRSVQLPALDLNGDGDTVDVADAPAVNDEDTFAGQPRKTTVFNGVESAPISIEVNQPWQGPVTATRNMGSTTVYARPGAQSVTWGAMKQSNGGWRVTRTNITSDNYGMPIKREDLGDVAVSGDESCTTTTYVRNTAANILSLAGTVENYALPCGQNPQNDGDVGSIMRTSFDNQAYGAAPTKGETTKVERASAWSSSGGPAWMTVSTKAYDPYGRILDETDTRGNHTTTAYTPATGGPVTRITSTNPNSWSSIDDIEPAWGETVGKTDVNGKRTDLVFDPLGRLTQVWLPNRAKAANPTSPNMQFTYTIRNSGGPSAITTQKLNANGNYMTEYELFDGLLRSRQTQVQSTANGNAGTVFTETKYDAAGRVGVTTTHFDATVQPSANLFTILDWQPKTLKETQYDRAGRAVVEIQKNGGVELSRITTTYNGEKVSTTAPAGQTSFTKVSDAQGRTVQLREYRNAADVGSDTRALYDLATYHYNKKGQQDSLTDNAGNVWTYGFDFLGRQTSSTDPDKGASSATFDAGGLMTSITDGRGQTLAYTYDTIGRKTGEYAGSPTGTKLATWAYDPTGNKGQLASASRWIGTDEYKVTIRGYTPLYQSTGEDFVIPTSVTGLAGTYSFTRAYKVDGSLSTMSYPNVGGLGAETLTYTYDDVTGLPEQLKTNAPGLGQYVANSDYTAYGELSFVQFQLTGGNWVQRGFTYDDATRKLVRAQTVRQVSPQPVTDSQYSLDTSGNITKLVETGASGTDTQCFAYDYVQRLTNAWTPTSGDCAQTRSSSALGGPAPYWKEWSFDAVGSRKTQVTHATAGDTTETYNYNAAGTARPHAVQSVTVSGPGVSRTDNYGYDLSGNTTGRPGTTGAQTLTWDTEGHLTKVTEGGKDTTHVYTADGARLLSSDSTTTTLYLPGQEVRRNKSTGAVTATRYYSWAGQVCASITTGGQLTWLVTDTQGTQQVAIASGNQALTQRRQDPYGNLRGTLVAWPNAKGFVGGDTDGTGLTHLGARDYDPKTGRFISVDPVFDPAVTQSWSAYVYAGNNPVTQSDPSGLCWLCDKAKQTFAAAWVNTVDVVGHAVGNELKKIDDFGQKVLPVIDRATEQMGGPIDAAWDMVQQKATDFAGTPSDPTAWRLGWEWATGNGPHDRVMEGEGRFVQTYKQHQHFQDTRAQVAEKINSGELKEGSQGDNYYSLANPPEESLGKVARDFTTNSAVAFLGSHNLHYTVKAIDKEHGTATVEFEITNDSTINSATHTSPVLGGYSDWWQEEIEKPLNRRFGESGPMSRKKQTIRWTETIDLKNPKPPSPPPSIPPLLNPGGGGSRYGSCRLCFL